jgi:hypothetical protein
MTAKLRLLLLSVLLMSFQAAAPLAEEPCKCPGQDPARQADCQLQRRGDGSCPGVFGVSFSGNPCGVAGAPIVLRPHIATTPGETIESYAWSFGDGTSSAQAKPKHVYDKEGLYLAELRVNTRSAGSPSSAWARV